MREGPDAGFTLFPAIDIQGGKCVRLRQGAKDDATVYGEPLEMALRFQRDGARALHMVDLDGAFAGEGKNLASVKRVVEGASIPVQLGGGIRTMDDVHRCLELGVWRVILGTAALKNPTLVKEAAKRYPGRVIVGIDARNGRVAVEGWVAETDTTPVELARRMMDAGIETVVYTDISLDGMLAGPNLAGTRELIERTHIRVIGSGGVAGDADILALRDIGAAGVIAGKAIYDGRVDLRKTLLSLAGGFE